MYKSNVYFEIYDDGIGDLIISPKSDNALYIFKFKESDEYICELINIRLRSNGSVEIKYHIIGGQSFLIACDSYDKLLKTGGVHFLNFKELSIEEQKKVWIHFLHTSKSNVIIRISDLYDSKGKYHSIDNHSSFKKLGQSYLDSTFYTYFSSQPATTNSSYKIELDDMKKKDYSYTKEEKVPIIYKNKKSNKINRKPLPEDDLIVDGRNIITMKSSKETHSERNIKSKYSGIVLNNTYDGINGTVITNNVLNYNYINSINTNPETGILSHTLKGKINDKVLVDENITLIKKRKKKKRAKLESLL